MKNTKQVIENEIEILTKDRKYYVDGIEQDEKSLIYNKEELAKIDERIKDFREILDIDKQ